MNRKEIKNLVKEAFIDKVYGKYPYSHMPGDDEEPKADYEEEWKSLVLHLVKRIYRMVLDLTITSLSKTPASRSPDDER